MIRMLRIADSIWQFGIAEMKTGDLCGGCGGARCGGGGHARRVERGGNV